MNEELRERAESLVSEIIAAHPECYKPGSQAILAARNDSPIIADRLRMTLRACRDLSPELQGRADDLLKELARPRGRPELPPDERTTPTTVRMIPADKAWCEAQEGGLSEYIRRLVEQDRKRQKRVGH